MTELLNVSFESGRLPADWVVERGPKGFDGRVMESGPGTTFDFVVPGGRWQRLRIETEVEPESGSNVEWQDRTIAIVIDFARKASRIIIGGTVLAEAKHDIPPKSGPYLLSFDFDRGRVRVSIDGREVVTADDPQPALQAGLMRVGFWNNCRVYGLRALGDGAEGVLPKSKPKKDFFLEVNVDYYDDLLFAPFTAGMFDQLFAEFKSWGTHRVHWIYYGNSTDGWWTRAPRGVAENARQTVENVGEIFPAAVKAAHRHNIEIYGLIKPFDMGFWLSVGESDPRAKTWGRLPRIGGPVGWIADFVADRRDLCMARKPGAWGEAKNKLFTQIDLVKDSEDPAAFTINDVNLFVSDDNTTYRPYTGPMTRQERIEDYPVWEHTSSGGRRTGATRRSRVMRFSNLNISQKYLALSVKNHTESFANSLINLIHVFGPDGEERLLTYGLNTRIFPDSWSDNMFVVKDNFQNTGINFDTWPGAPAATSPGFNAFKARYAFDSSAGLLGVARGKEKNPVACLSPSFPEARAWWLEWVKECLDAGADGIELRDINHHSPLTFAEFGFEEPVVRLFKERYGVDLLTTDDFDQAAWQRLRGEAMTEFYRETRKLVSSRGKRLGLHISQAMCFEPEFGSAMDIHWDWRTWLKEGLADSVTMKEVWPYSRFGLEVMKHTSPKDVPMIFSPFHDLPADAIGARAHAQRIQFARRSGFSGFQLYECCSVIRGTKNGQILMIEPDLKDVFRKEFTR